MKPFLQILTLGVVLLAACNQEEEPVDACIVNNSPYRLRYWGYNGGHWGPLETGGNQFCRQMEPGAVFSWRADYVNADASFVFASWQGSMAVEPAASNRFEFSGQPELLTYDFRDNGLVGSHTLTCTCVEVTATGDTLAITTETIVASVTKSPTRIDQVAIDAGPHYSGPGLFNGEPLFDLSDGAGKGFFMEPGRFELYTVRTVTDSIKKYCTCK